MSINQNVTVYVRQRVQSATAKQGSIVLLVTIDGDSSPISLKISWPSNLFDSEAGVLLPRHEKDEFCIQQNLKIKNEKGIVETLVFRFYALGKVITHDIIRRELGRKTSKDDVLENFKVAARELVSKRIVEYGTYKHYHTVFNRIEKYFKKTGSHWKFNNFDENELVNHQQWLLANYTHNTTAGHMRVIKKFSTVAMKAGQLLEHPSDDVKTLSFQKGVRDILYKAELTKYYKYFTEYGLEQLTPLEYDVARRYLICCFTGLRKSDVEQLDPRIHIRNNNILRLSMFKTRKYGKVVEFNMPQVAVNLIGKKRGILFPAMESSILCKTLRRTIAKAGIDKYLKFHSSRDTFATNYIVLGGNPIMLQDILGHSLLSTTMIYVKLANDTNNETMKLFDTLIL